MSAPDSGRATAQEGRRSKVEVQFGVLGPIAAWGDDGLPLALRGPKHQAVLARLLVARGRTVPVDRLVDDLWFVPPEGAVGAVRTFVAALRRSLEPDRAPRAPALLLVTDGPGYALRVAPEAVDAWRFEQALAAAATQTPAAAEDAIAEALTWWRGPAYAGLDEEPWARAERSRLTELRLHAVEQLGAARLARGGAAEAVPDLDAHAAEHPWREDAWRLLALALYRSGRQGDALAVLHRARSLLVDQLGVEPGPTLRRLEADVLAQAAHLDLGPDTAPPQDPTARLWAEAAASYDRTVATGARARLESTVDLLRNLAVTGGGGLREARRHRRAAVAAAEELGDPELTARVIGAYDVPAIWTRSDDPQLAADLVAAAERALTALPATAPDALRTRLLATIAVESRGAGGRRAPDAAGEAELLARRLDDPALLAFALNGRFMQAFGRCGLAPQRAAIGAELVALATHHGLTTSEVLGHLIAIQAAGALGDLATADHHAAAVEEVADRHELPLVAPFARWYRALRLGLEGRAPADEVDAAYAAAAAGLAGTGMPGLEDGLAALARLATCAQFDRPAPTEALDWGPYEPWARPLVLLAGDDRAAAAAALHLAPEPPPDLLQEGLWVLLGRAAIALRDRSAVERAHAALLPAAAEHAGAASGLVTFGPVTRHLDELSAALGR